MRVMHLSNYGSVFETTFRMVSTRADEFSLSRTTWVVADR